MRSNIKNAIGYMNAKFKKFIKDERGDVNIVSIVVLIGVAVLLAIIFKDAIADLLKSLLDSIKKNGTNLVNSMPE